MLSWETLIGLARSSGGSASAASSTLREAQPEYRMCVRASWAVMRVYFIYRTLSTRSSRPITVEQSREAQRGEREYGQFAIICERTSAALRHKRAYGQVLNHAPYGFDAEDGVLTPNPREKSILERDFGAGGRAEFVRPYVGKRYSDRKRP